MDRDLFPPEAVLGLIEAPGQSLDKLYISCEIQIDILANAVPVQWPRDTQLHVAMPMESEILTDFAARRWPVKSMLLKEDLDLPSLAMEELASCDLVHMEELSFEPFDLLEDDKDDLPRAVQVMITSNWPALRKLDLSGQGLVFGCIVLLTFSNWPLLESLDLSGNDIGLMEAHQLTEGNWPMLLKVDLSLSSNPEIFDDDDPYGDVQARIIQGLCFKWPILYVCLTRYWSFPDGVPESIDSIGTDPESDDGRHWFSLSSKVRLN